MTPRQAYQTLVNRRRFKSRLVMEAYDAWLATGQRGGMANLQKRFEKVRATYAAADAANKHAARNSR